MQQHKKNPKHYFRLGAAWKGLCDEARKKYHDMAHREDLEHRRKYPSKLVPHLERVSGQAH